MNNELHEPLSAGQLLRKAREERNMTVQEVALQLNLRVAQVNSLENDKFDSTMLATYARGYVRAYGRLVKVPESQLMAAFSKQSGVLAPDANPMRTFSNRTGNQATEKRFMWLTYAIIALLVALPFMWWWQTSQESRESLLNAKPVAVENMITDGEQAFLEMSEGVQIIEASNVNEMSDTAVEDVVTTEPLPAEPILDAPPKSAENTQVIEQNIEVTLPVATTTVATNIDALEMRFKENCWIDVVDAEGNRIAYGTKQAGYIMQVTGKAPFVVTLGNPSVVSINFNQHAFDTSVFPAGRVAKFSIPES